MKGILAENYVFKNALSKLLVVEEPEYPCFKCKKRKCKGCKHNHSFNMSSAGDCERKIALNWLFGSGEFSSQIKRKMLLGKILHSGLGELLGKEHNIQTEIVVKQELPTGQIISGRIDFLVDNVPVELKTTAATSFKYLPRKKDISQLEFYLELTGYEYGELVYMPVSIADNIIADSDYFLNFDDCKFRKVFKNETVSYLKIFENIFKTLQQNELPERRLTNQCKNCSHTKRCLELP